MIILFTQYQTTTIRKWMFSQKRLFKSSSLVNGECGIQVHHPQNNNELSLLFCLDPASMWGEGSVNSKQQLGSQ